MTRKKVITKMLVALLAILLALPQGLMAQDAGAVPVFKQEELDQLIAPVALYPDDLLAEVFMASTYPLEVVQAARWAKANSKLKDDQLTKALEQQPWDPSVKALVNFPQTLQMMNEKLDWTQKLGDAFLAQQKQVMDTVQNLRRKADAQGNLKTTQEQKIVIEQQTQVIKIEPANPQVIYVPTYNPTIVYGPWWYPAYPPYYWYPPGYIVGPAFVFAAGVAVGVAWGYAWGGCNWAHGNVYVNVNRNININNNINRNNYMNRPGQGGQGEWQHDPDHRKGVTYRDQGTAQKYNKGQAANTQAREAFRGRADAGRQDLAREGTGQGREGAGTRSAQGQDRGQQGLDRQRPDSQSDRSAFSNPDHGKQATDFSNRGNESLSSRPGGSGGGGGGSSISRGGGGGGGRGGGGRGR
jgi:uncharacterized membrane protein YgcG